MSSPTMPGRSNLGGEASMRSGDGLERCSGFGWRLESVDRGEQDEQPVVILVCKDGDAHAVAG